MQTYRFTISCPGCWLDETQVSRRAGSRPLAELHIRGVISRMANAPETLALLPRP